MLFKLALPMPVYNFQTVQSPKARTFDPDHGCELRLVRSDRDNLSAFELAFPDRTIPFAAEWVIVTRGTVARDGINELHYTVFVNDFLRNLPNWSDVQDAIHASLTAYGFNHGRGPNRTGAVYFQ